eukprot:1351554-Amorphochlora_amoeboformis.AAC.3
MSELKLTGNCLKGSRPILFFDKTFDTTPTYKLLKEMFIQVSCPRYGEGLFASHFLHYPLQGPDHLFMSF